MELLNRYLHAVGARLPERYREDIVAELRGELLSRIEEREAELCRPLTEAEVVALLKACGHPLVVAASYVHGEHLISPALLPFYRFTAKVLIGVAVLVHFIYVVVALLFRESLGHVLGTAVNSLWIVSMYLLGGVTFGALIFDRIGAGRWLARAWSPRYLPRAPRRRAVGALLALDAVAVVALAGWVSGAIPVWTWIARPVAVHVHPIGLWSAAGTVLLLAAVSMLATHAIERSVPRFALACLVAKLLQSLAVLSLAVVLVADRPWLQVSNVDPAVGRAFAAALDLTMEIGVGVLAAAAAVGLGLNLIRLLRWARRTGVHVHAAA